jgi:hypothetical protein
MEYWEYILECDMEADLTDPKAGRDRARQVGIGLQATDGSWLTDDELVELDQSLAGWFDVWARNVRVLRSLAARLEKKKTREPGIDPFEADRVFSDHLGRLKVTVLKVPSPRPGRPKTSPRISKPTDVKSFMASLGGGNLPEMPLDRKSFAGIKLEVPSPTCFHDSFWLDIFLSLADHRFRPPVCADCGSPLPPTPKMRTSRRKLCATCRSKDRRFRMSQSPDTLEKLRQKWKEQRAAHRAKQQKPKDKKG